MRLSDVEKAVLAEGVRGFLIAITWLAVVVVAVVTVLSLFSGGASAQEVVGQPHAARLRVVELGGGWRAWTDGRVALLQLDGVLLDRLVPVPQGGEQALVGPPDLILDPLAVTPRAGLVSVSVEGLAPAGGSLTIWNTLGGVQAPPIYGPSVGDWSALPPLVKPPPPPADPPPPGPSGAGGVTP